MSGWNVKNCYKKIIIGVIAIVSVLLICSLMFSAKAIAKDNTPTIEDLPSVNSLDLPEGKYYIVASYAPTKALDVSNGSSDNGANVQLYDANSTSAQLWSVDYDEKGYATITNGSGKVLDVSGAVAQSGTNVWQYQSNKSAAQKWVISKVGDSYRIESALGSTLVLDIAWGSADNGANAQIYSNNGSAAQRFLFLPATNQKITGEKVIEDGEYSIALQSNKNKVIDITGGLSADGTNAQLYEDNGTTAQIFHFVYDATTQCYTIYCIGTGKVLDACGAGMIPCTNVWQYTSNDTDAQKWAITKRVDGSLIIQNRLSGLCFDIAGGSTDNGANLNLYVSNNTKAQKFVLKEKQLFSDGLINIKSCMSENMSIDVPDCASTEGLQLQICTSNSNYAQKFYCEIAADKTITFSNLANGMYIAESNGKVVQTATLSDSAKWNSIWNGSGIALVNKVSGNAIDISGGKATAHAKLVTSSLSMSKSQSFRWNGTSVIDTSVVYEIYPACATSNRIDLDNYSWCQGANIHMWSGGDRGNIKWRFEPYGDHWRIISAYTEYVMDVSNGSSADGTNVQQYGWNGTGAQLWDIKIDKDGWFTIVNVGTGKVLDVANGSSAPGANVHIWTANGSNAQKWKIVETGGFTFSGDGELDNIIRDCCRQHPTLEDCFYTIANFNYVSGSIYPSGEWSIPFAKEMWYNHGGNCYRFAALFKWVARGFNVGSEAISGHVPNRGGGLAPHGWVEIYNGGTYVCDPDLQHEMPGYQWYMTTYETAPVQYYK